MQTIYRTSKCTFVMWKYKNNIKLRNKEARVI